MAGGDAGAATPSALTTSNSSTLSDGGGSDSADDAVAALMTPPARPRRGVRRSVAAVAVSELARQTQPSPVQKGLSLPALKVRGRGET